MNYENDSQKALLAHLRHELRTPINAIIGYSEMLLEELEEEQEENLLLIEPLKTIQSCGRHLLSQVNITLSPTILESSVNIDLLSQTIRISMEATVVSVIEHCQQLLQQESSSFTVDIEKIHWAAQSLLAMVCDIANLSCQPLPLNEGTIFLTNKNSDTNTDVKELSGPLGRLLIVDDNPFNRDLLSLQIQQQGYSVGVAADGKEAIAAIETGKYDLILLDIIMPEINGYQVLQWLHESDWRHIPVITISALDELDSAVKCIEMGAEDYLTKPFNPVLLRARIGASLEKKRLRDREAHYLGQLAQANREITALNERLKFENLRLSAELEIAQQLQQMILPKDKELSAIENVEIAGFMQPADEVGGDYYDVLQHNGRVKIGIGDVTGHGLESGVLTIMVQTAIRTLIESNETDSKKFLEVLNRIIYKNAQRMNSDKNMTLSLVDYAEGKVCLSGQHEEMLVVRANGDVERIDTIDLGFPLGLEENITDFIAQTQIQLDSQDVMILYTDGIPEAENELGIFYGQQRLCEIVKQNRHKTAIEIRQFVIDDLHEHIGKHKIYDDITLLILKQK